MWSAQQTRPYPPLRICHDMGTATWTFQDSVQWWRDRTQQWGSHWGIKKARQWTSDMRTQHAQLAESRQALLRHTMRLIEEDVKRHGTTIPLPWLYAEALNYGFSDLNCDWYVFCRRGRARNGLDWRLWYLNGSGDCFIGICLVWLSKRGSIRKVVACRGRFQTCDSF